MSVIGEEDLVQDSNIDIINEIDKEMLSLKCPEHLVNATEDEVLILFKSIALFLFNIFFYLLVCSVG